jgi:hypothetical protein
MYALSLTANNVDLWKYSPFLSEVEDLYSPRPSQDSARNPIDYASSSQRGSDSLLYFRETYTPHEESCKYHERQGCLKPCCIVDKIPSVHITMSEQG